MKKVLLSIALAAGFANAAVAADLPVKARAMAPAPVVGYSWTGCYLGAGGGYGMFNQDIYTDAASTAVPGGRIASQTITQGGRGWFGTVQAGCDYQFSDRWVLGVFGDYDFSGMKGSITWPRGGATYVAEEKQDYTWAVGGRLGYVVFPKLLAYVAGGYTETQFKDMNPLTAAFATTTPAVATVYLPGQKYKGWFLASGYEYGIDFIPGLFWKTEYRFADYRAENLPFTTVTTGAATGDFINAHKYVQTIRSELVYRFSWGPGPVVARY